MTDLDEKALPVWDQYLLLAAVDKTVLQEDLSQVFAVVQQQNSKEAVTCRRDDIKWSDYYLEIE